MGTLKLTNETGVSISKDLIGLFFEDINFAADGGLYAEMIENRSFEAKDAFGTPGYFYTIDDPGYAWKPYSEGDKEPRLQYIQGAPVSEANPHYLRITATEAGQGFENKAYDGIALKRGMKYNVSFYARCVTYRGEYFKISVIKDGEVFASVKVNAVGSLPYLPFTDLPGLDDNGYEKHFSYLADKVKEINKLNDGTRVRQNSWVKYEAELIAERDVRGAGFVVSLDAEGAVDFDLISVIPEDAVEGIFRKDLFDALEELNPAFIRFPGGCIVEGISLENRYRWKRTVGDIKDRKYIPNLWAFDDDREKESQGLDVQRPDSHYGQSYGLGFYEFFVLCEKLGAKALPVMNIAVACQFRSTEVVPIDSPEFNEYVQDALDLIEFANGPVDSVWGGLRAKMGHPESFNLTMIGIGNEQWETKYLDFYDRYDRFAKAIQEKYPEIKLVGSAGPMVENVMSDDAWDKIREKAKTNKDYCYAVDEHYYVSPKWMYEHSNFYDTYPRQVGVFAGEYAAHTEKRENNMEGALAEAALLCGLEKNADVIKLASYAPLFNRVGHSQWKPDMIWFDDVNVYRTPSYQVQKLFSNNMGVCTMPMHGQEKELQAEEIYVSVVRAKNGDTIIKAVNPSSIDKELGLLDESGMPIIKEAAVQILKGENEYPIPCLEESYVSECAMKVEGKIVLPAKTFAVIRF